FCIYPPEPFSLRHTILSFSRLPLFDQRVSGLRLNGSKLPFGLLDQLEDFNTVGFGGIRQRRLQDTNSLLKLLLGQNRCIHALYGIKGDGHDKPTLADLWTTPKQTNTLWKNHAQVLVRQMLRERSGLGIASEFVSEVSSCYSNEALPRRGSLTHSVIDEA